MDDRIARAKELLRTVRHAAMATVNEDGSPHNTPYFFMYDATLTHVYWGSHAESQHSKNVARTGQIFIALYSENTKGGLYLKADNARITEGEELNQAVVVHNQARARFGKTPPIDRAYYEQGAQHMYAADIKQMWVNLVERGPNGEHLRDYRHEVTADDLLEPPHA